MAFSTRRHGLCFDRENEEMRRPFSTDSKYSHLGIFKEPKCLIGTEPGGKTLVVDQQCLTELNQLEEELVVVAIAGPYRTGKSYLMNKLSGHCSGFPLGSTVEAKTKGIWTWCRHHPVNRQQILLLIDTEGLGDIKKGSKENDIWILTLAVLLSSIFVFNLLSAMNAGVVENMGLVSEVATRLQSYCPSDDGYRVFPDFILSLRDFHLDLEIDGKTVTPDEYLEHSLRHLPEEGTTSSRATVREYNQLKTRIKKCFRRRECFVFARPACRDFLLKLEEIASDQLNPQFVRQTNSFCESIFHRTSVKYLVGHQTANGPRFCHLLTQYVEAINNGAVPSIYNAVQALAIKESERAGEEAVKMYYELICACVVLPTRDFETLFNIHKRCMKQVVGILEGRALDVVNKKGLKSKLKELIRHEFDFINRENDGRSISMSEELIEKLYAATDAKYRQASHLRIGSRQYKSDMATLEQTFRKSMPKLGLQAEGVLERFLESKKEELGHLLQREKRHEKNRKESESLQKQFQFYREKSQQYSD